MYKTRVATNIKKETSTIQIEFNKEVFDNKKRWNFTNDTIICLTLPTKTLL